MDIEIESGIPIPPRRVRGHAFRKGALKGVLARFAVGQSFLYPQDRKNAVYCMARLIDVKIQSVTAEDAPGFVRVWRVE
jgi:hypothetical protein